MRKIIFLLLMIADTMFAQTADSLFVTANNLYKKGKVEQAI